jgi:coiled-coil domain-containing protein 151
VKAAAKMSKALSKEEISLNAHVEELRERMRMLQSDRTANVDVLEANKTANKDEIKRLRGDNKDLRQKLAQLQRVRCCC